MRDDLRRRLPELHAAARQLAVLGLDEFAEEEAARLLPERCPFTLDQILQQDWSPERAGA